MCAQKLHYRTASTVWYACSLNVWHQPACHAVTCAHAVHTVTYMHALRVTLNGAWCTGVYSKILCQLFCVYYNEQLQGSSHCGAVLLGNIGPPNVHLMVRACGELTK